MLDGLVDDAWVVAQVVAAEAQGHGLDCSRTSRLSGQVGLQFPRGSAYREGRKKLWKPSDVNGCDAKLFRGARQIKKSFLTFFCNGSPHKNVNFHQVVPTLLCLVAVDMSEVPV